MDISKFNNNNKNNTILDFKLLFIENKENYLFKHKYEILHFIKLHLHK